MRGTGGTLFVPDRPITREEAAVLLRRYAAHLGRDTFCPAEWPPVTTLRDLPWADDSSTGPQASACWRGARTAGRSPRAPSPRRSWSRPSPVF
ncbi:S-layer homology domain-containing protein [Flavonifractor plautii]|nr:S-layer homology domain-containing protein [Flavonifractor plautii]